MADRALIPFIGVYDVFSATLAGRHFDSLFVSGFGFAASHYGLPDIGFITWTDIVDYVQRLRTVLPFHHLLVDIDDGYCDPEVACHVVSVLEAAGASGVVLEIRSDHAAVVTSRASRSWTSMNIWPSCAPFWRPGAIWS
jgi:2-methylisocitrate lyase-like PEP mutase family enzyme